MRSARPLDEAGEGLRRPEQPRIEEIEDRPQVAKIVLDRRAGERDAALGLQRLDGAGLPGAGVLDRLRFVDDGEPPAGLADPVEPQQRAVARHHEIGPGEFFRRGRPQPFGRGESGMGDEHVERRRETLGLGRPICEQRRRRDDQARPPLAAAARRASASGPAPGWSCRAPCRRQGRRRGRAARESRASAGRRPGRAAASPSAPRPDERPRASRGCGRRRARRRARGLRSHAPTRPPPPAPPRSRRRRRPPGAASPGRTKRPPCAPGARSRRSGRGSLSAARRRPRPIGRATARGRRSRRGGPRSPRASAARRRG